MLFTASRECSSGYRRCPNGGRCIDEDYFCDGDNDCGDLSDENPDECRKSQTTTKLTTTTDDDDDDDAVAIIITSLPKLIWEEDHVAALSHTYAVKSPLVTMARPKFAPKVPLPVDRSQASLPASSLDPSDLMPNGIRILSAVFQQCIEQTDARIRTDRRTDRQIVHRIV